MSKKITSPLSSPTLVLNKHWQAIDSTTAQKALIDVVSDKAKIMCPKTYEQYNISDWMKLKTIDGEPCIKSVRQDIKVPEIIINCYDKMPRKKVIFSRRNILKRDCHRCQYCGILVPADDWTIDHVMPKSRGGTSRFDNCVVACTKCNRAKDNKTPEEAKMRLRQTRRGKDGKEVITFYHRPVAPKWNPSYNIKRFKIPKSWESFLGDFISEVYWNIELED